MSLSAADAILLRLVTAGGFLDEGGAEAARRQAESEGIPLRHVLIRSGISADILGALEIAARGASSTSANEPVVNKSMEPGSAATIIAAPRPASTAPAHSNAFDSPTVTSAKPQDAGATVSGPSAAPVKRRTGRLTHIGKYEILTEIGRGGMGIVYRARHPGLDRTVAVKTLIATGSPEHVERFQREARSAARMGKHPNLVQVHDVGEDDGIYFMTMEFIEGGSFDREIHVDKVPPRRVAEVVEQVARGLAQAHAEGVIHRDLKPANVLIDATRRPLLTDFGLAKEVGGDSSVSVAGQVLGTPAYMSPEQAEGKLDGVNERSDVYGLGAILYEGLTRFPPFQANGNIELLRKVAEQEPVPPSRLVENIPRDLEVICLKCLSKSPADRYESAAALADDLKRFLDGEPIQARPIPFTVRLLRKARRNALVVSLAAAAVVLLAVGSVITVRLVRERAAKQKEQTRLDAEQRARDERRAKVEEHFRNGRESLDKAERAMRIDVASLAGRAIGSEPLESAVKSFDAALAIDPAQRDARRLRARSLRLLGRYEESIEEADRALAQTPGDPSILYDRAQARLSVLSRAQGMIITSDYSYNPALGKHGLRKVVLRRDPRANEIRASVVADVQQLEGVGLPPAPAAYCRGLLLALDEKYAEALPVFDEALKLDPFLTEAILTRGEVLLYLGDAARARKEYEKLVLAIPFDSTLQLQCGMLQETWVEAQPYVDRGVELAPTSAMALRIRGECNASYSRHDDAERDFRAAIAIDPQNAQSLQGLFFALTMRGDVPDAEPFARRSLEINPDNFTLAYDLGIVYRMLSRHTDAVAMFDIAISFDPEFGGYLWARGRSRIMAGLVKEGVKDMFDAVASGDLSPTARKMYDTFRASSESKIASTDDPQRLAGVCEGLITLLGMLSGSASEDRKKQYAWSANTLHWISCDLHEKATGWDKALFAIKNMLDQGEFEWGLAYRRARISSQRTDIKGTLEYLHEARSQGMTRLGCVRTDPGFKFIREWDGWKEFEQAFEAGR